LRKKKPALLKSEVNYWNFKIISKYLFFNITANLFITLAPVQLMLLDLRSFPKDQSLKTKEEKQLSNWSTRRDSLLTEMTFQTKKTMRTISIIFWRTRIKRSRSLMKKKQKKKMTSVRLTLRRIRSRLRRS